MLGAAASEIANMDATSKMRRQKLEAIKSHLRYLRVPGFLTLPIMEVSFTPSFTPSITPFVIPSVPTCATTCDTLANGNAHPPPNSRPDARQFYETLFAKKQALDDNDILKDMPSSLKVQLAVVLNEDFLKKARPLRARYAPVTRLLCARYTPDTRPLRARYAPVTRPLRARYAPATRPLCAHYAPVTDGLPRTDAPSSSAVGASPGS